MESTQPTTRFTSPSLGLVQEQAFKSSLMATRFEVDCLLRDHQVCFPVIWHEANKTIHVASCLLEKAT